MGKAEDRIVYVSMFALIITIIGGIFGRWDIIILGGTLMMILAFLPERVRMEIEIED